MAAWDMYQHQQIKGLRMGQLSSEQQALKRDIRIEQQADQIGIRVDRLSMIVEALWKIVQEQTGKSDAELVTLVQQVIVERQPKPPRDCPQCASKVAWDIDRCQICGQSMPIQRSLFEV